MWCPSPLTSRLSFSLLFALLLGSSLLFVGCQQRTIVEPGAPVVDFQLNDLQGSPIKFSSFKGKRVLINFMASWCTPCVAELPALQRLYERNRDGGESGGLAVLGVAIDDNAADLREMLLAAGVTFPVVLDETGRLKREFKVVGVPESFVVDTGGKLVLFPDPEKGPAVRIVGDRKWDSPVLEKLLREVP
jgi:thiol-disulfide isomerase/thioredoxin